MKYMNALTLQTLWTAQHSDNGVYIQVSLSCWISYSRLKLLHLDRWEIPHYCYMKQVEVREIVVTNLKKWLFYFETIYRRRNAYSEKSAGVIFHLWKQEISNFLIFMCCMLLDTGIVEIFRYIRCNMCK